MAIELTIAIAAAVITGLNEVIKKAVGKEVKPYLPLIAVILGIIFTFSYDLLPGITENLISGIAIGLMAVGLFEEGKNLKEIAK